MSFVNLDGAHAAANFKGPAFAQNSHRDNNQAAQSFEAKLQEYAQQSAPKKNEQPNQNQISHSSGWFDRGLGLLQAGAGVLEIVGGAAFGLATSETGVGAVAGGAIALHGIDDIQAGLRQAWSGRPIETFTQQAASGAAERLGADRKLAIAIGIGVDLAASGGVGGAEKAGVKALEEGGKLLEGGSKVLEDGSKLLPDGVSAEKILDEAFGVEKATQSSGPAAEKALHEVTQLGGAYRDVKGLAGYEAHHMPANSISPFPSEEGPSIAMLTKDHRLTASWGNSRDARAYRRAQADLVAQGDFRGAQQMDIIDIQTKFGAKYDDAIRQMIEYSRTKRD